MRLTLGNPAALDGSTPLDGNRETIIDIPDSYSVDEAVRTVLHSNGAWVAHSSADAPAWVEGDHDELVAAIAQETGCPVGRPDNWNG